MTRGDAFAGSFVTRRACGMLRQQRHHESPSPGPTCPHRRLEIAALDRGHAWRGYASSFPNYAICPRNLETDDGVAVLGHTSGSHLGLSVEEEQRLTVIWFARIEGEQLSLWRLFQDTPRHRDELGLGRNS